MKRKRSVKRNLLLLAMVLMLGGCASTNASDVAVVKDDESIVASVEETVEISGEKVEVAEQSSEASGFFVAESIVEEQTPPQELFKQERQSEIFNLNEEVPLAPTNTFADEGEWWLCDIYKVAKFDLANSKCYAYDEELELYKIPKYWWTAEEKDNLKHEWSFEYDPITSTITFTSNDVLFTYAFYNLGNGFVKFVALSPYAESNYFGMEEFYLYGTEDIFTGNGTWLVLRFHEGGHYLKFNQSEGKVVKYWYNLSAYSSKVINETIYNYTIDNGTLILQKDDGTNVFQSTFILGTFHNTVMVREKYCLSTPRHIEYLYTDYLMFRSQDIFESVIDSLANVL